MSNSPRNTNINTGACWVLCCTLDIAIDITEKKGKKEKKVKGGGGNGS
jgi:hypothetical protein